MLVAGVSSLLFAHPASAANGDQLRQIIADRTGTQCASYDAAGHHSSVGVGVAFNGVNLLISCYSDNTVTEVRPSDGSQVAIHAISGAGSLGALAWDAAGGVMWACSNFNDVGTVDLATNVFTYKFTSGGCFDGLAFDGSNSTIFASADASTTLNHYSAAGVLLDTHSVLLGSCGNSGIAVGGSLLYLANNGCSQIWTAPKDVSSTALFATFPARIEDLECDNLTFAAQGKGAIWSIDAYDNILNAWEIPTGTCTFGGQPTPTATPTATPTPTPTPTPPPASEKGRMTGGGTIKGTDVRHGFEVRCDMASDPKNNLEVTWGKGNKFHLEQIVGLSCLDDPAIPNPKGLSFDSVKGFGVGRLNGQPGAQIEFEFTDAGEPGKNDEAEVKITDAGNVAVLVAKGTLASGNQQAHK